MNLELKTDDTALSAVGIVVRPGGAGAHGAIPKSSNVQHVTLKTRPERCGGGVLVC